LSGKLFSLDFVLLRLVAANYSEKLFVQTFVCNCEINYSGVLLDNGRQLRVVELGEDVWFEICVKINLQILHLEVLLAIHDLDFFLNDCNKRRVGNVATI
jgi:hypothetical protein